MASGNVAGCGWNRKEKSKNGRLWDEVKTVRKKMNGVGGEADCGRIRKEKSKNGRLCGEGIRIRRKMNGLGKRSGLRTDPQRKREGGGGMGQREAARARKSEEFWKMKRSRI